MESSATLTPQPKEKCRDWAHRARVGLFWAGLLLGAMYPDKANSVVETVGDAMIPETVEHWVDNGIMKVADVLLPPHNIVSPLDMPTVSEQPSNVR